MKFDSIGIHVVALIVFSSLERKYELKSLKSIVRENSIAKINSFNVLLNIKNSKCDSDQEKFIKFRINLLSILGEKISTLIHTFFLFENFITLSEKLVPKVCFLYLSRKNSFVDLKLLLSSLNKILRYDSNKNSIFKEEFELLKAEYLFQIRLIDSSFRVLTKIFLFPFTKNRNAIFNCSANKMFKFLKMLVFRINSFNFRNQKTKLSPGFSNYSENNPKPFGRDCSDFFFEKIEKFLKVQINWIQNRHFLKKILREKQFLRSFINYDQLDLYGLFGLQKLNINNDLISCELFFFKDFCFHRGDIIKKESQANINLLAMLAEINKN